MSDARHSSEIEVRGVRWVNMDMYHPEDTMVCYMAKFGDSRAIADSEGHWEVRSLRFSRSALANPRTLQAAMEIATDQLIDTLAKT